MTILQISYINTSILRISNTRADMLQYDIHHTLLLAYNTMQTSILLQIFHTIIKYILHYYRHLILLQILRTNTHTILYWHIAQTY